MFNLSNEIICRIIFKARDFFGKEAVDKSGDPAESKDNNDDSDYQILASYRGDFTYAELKSVIKELDPDQQATLVALLWIGRGDYTAKEWSTAYQEAMRNWTTETAEYLLTKPLLADHLQDALAEFNIHCDEDLF